MAELFVEAGVCGFTARITTTTRPDGMVALTVSTDCPHVARLAQALPEIDPLREITYRGEGPAVLQAAAATLPHPACVVPAAILKAVEVAAGLALPRDPRITFVVSEE
jgi:hypothetical protein